MKKLFSIILATVLLCASMLVAIPSVSAAKDDEWIMGPDAAYIKHDGKTYYPIPDLPYYEITFHSKENYSMDYLEGETEEITKEIFPYTKVNYSTAEDYPWIEVIVPSYSYSDTTVLYVEESYYDEYLALANGTAATYVCSNNYDYGFYLDYTASGLKSFTLNPMDIEKWKTGEAINTKSFLLEKYDFGQIHGFDKKGTISLVCGVFYVDEENQEVYLQPTSSRVTNDNYYFGNDMYSDVTVYRLEDEKLRDELIEYFYTEPEDELQWLEPEEDDMTFGVAFAVFIFGIIPAFVLVFSVAMLFLVKDKRRYSPAYITMIVGSVIVLVSCIILLICLI